MTFSFYRLRFRFQALDSLHFPAGKTGNIVRGAFGLIFRRLVCSPDCPGASICERRHSCAYSRVFEPRSAHADAPSGLHDWPRPFVFRARNLDGCRIPPGEPLWFDVHLFDSVNPSIEHFVSSFAQLAGQGIGPRRGRARLVGVDQLDLHDRTVTSVFSVESGFSSQPILPSVLDLHSWPSAPPRVRVCFLSPTELKSDSRIVERPEFPALFGRLRDRVSTLRALYGEGPLPVDFRGLGERAALVRLVRTNIHGETVERRSGRTGQTHSIGGFVGEAEYEGELAEFLPYLAAGRWTGVGRQTVWGKGEIRVDAQNLPGSGLSPPGSL